MEVKEVLCLRLRQKPIFLEKEVFRFKVGHDVAFKYKGSYYIGIIDSIDEAESYFTCSSMLKDKKSFENTKFYVKYVEDLDLTYVD